MSSYMGDTYAKAYALDGGRLSMQEGRESHAARLFSEIVRAMGVGELHGTQLLQQVIHACDIAGWHKEREEFYRELNGYPADVPLPWYREQVQGTASWSYDLTTVTPSPIYRLAPLPPPELFPLPWRSQFQQIVVNAQNDSYMHLEAQDYPLIGPHEIELGTYRMNRTVTLPAWTFARIVGAVEAAVFDLASKAVVRLRYGEAVHDVWNTYRVEVDGALATLGIDNLFNRVQADFVSPDPERWRGALTACRDVLVRLSDVLWAASGDSYAAIPTHTGQPLNVARAHYANRIGAYLHAKGASSVDRRFLQAEAELISGWVLGLVGIDNQFHDPAPITREDVSLAVISTYTLIAQLAIRTDLEPVTDETLAGVAVDD